MSFRRVQNNGVSNLSTYKSKSYIYGSDWVRNPTWLTMPSITSSNEEVDMLVAVYPESNFIAFTFNTSSGTYHVDWGDTQTSDIVSTVGAYHQYDYNDANLVGTDGPVTFTASTSKVNRTSHGYTNGMTISFAIINTTTGITANQYYYVVNATTNDFQLSSTPDGSPITLTNDGTGSILPYKQAIIKVTPNTGGATLTTVNLQVRHTASLLQTYTQPILDLTISANCSSLTIAGGTVPTTRLERCRILRHNSTSFSNLFQNSYSLQSVYIADYTSVTTVNSMFNSCYALKSIPLFNTSSVTDFTSFCQACYSLQVVPNFNTSSAQNMGSMFFNCRSLSSVPLFNTASVTNMTTMFSSCFSLQSVPLFNTASVTNMSGMFQSCYMLQSVPLFNTASVTNMSSMFTSCVSLQSVPLFNTSNVTDTSSMFSACNSLDSIPQFNLSKVTTALNMFQNCYTLKYVPNLDLSSATSISGMFQSCTSLMYAPTLTTTSSLTTTASTFQTCLKLISVPLFNTSGVNTMNSMFNGCTALQYIPLFNTSSVTSMSSMFNGCTSLKSVPALNTSLVSAFSSIVTACQSLNDFNITSAGAATASSGYNTMFSSCTSLSKITTTGFKFTFTVTACKLSPAALDAIYTGLATVTGQTITVTNNWGTASDTPSIATAKGWTVTG